MLSLSSFDKTANAADPSQRWGAPSAPMQTEEPGYAEYGWLKMREQLSKRLGQLDWYADKLSSGLGISKPEVLERWAQTLKPDDMKLDTQSFVKKLIGSAAGAMVDLPAYAGASAIGTALMGPVAGPVAAFGTLGAAEGLQEGGLKGALTQGGLGAGTGLGFGLMSKAALGPLGRALGTGSLFAGGDVAGKAITGQPQSFEDFAQSGLLGMGMGLMGPRKPRGPMRPGEVRPRIPGEDVRPGTAPGMGVIPEEAPTGLGPRAGAPGTPNLLDILGISQKEAPLDLQTAMGQRPGTADILGLTGEKQVETKLPKGIKYAGEKKAIEKPAKTSNLATDDQVKDLMRFDVSEEDARALTQKEAARIIKESRKRHVYEKATKISSFDKEALDVKPEERFDKPSAYSFDADTAIKEGADKREAGDTIWAKQQWSKWSRLNNRFDELKNKKRVSDRLEKADVVTKMSEIKHQLEGYAGFEKESEGFSGEPRMMKKEVTKLLHDVEKELRPQGPKILAPVRKALEARGFSEEDIARAKRTARDKIIQGKEITNLTHRITPNGKLEAIPAEERGKITSVEAPKEPPVKVFEKQPGEDDAAAAARFEKEFGAEVAEKEPSAPIPKSEEVPVPSTQLEPEKILIESSKRWDKLGTLPKRAQQQFKAIAIQAARKIDPKITKIEQAKVLADKLADESKLKSSLGLTRGQEAQEVIDARKARTSPKVAEPEGEKTVTGVEENQPRQPKQTRKEFQDEPAKIGRQAADPVAAVTDLTPKAHTGEWLKRWTDWYYTKFRNEDPNQLRERFRLAYSTQLETRMAALAAYPGQPGKLIPLSDFVGQMQNSQDPSLKMIGEMGARKHIMVKDNMVKDQEAIVKMEAIKRRALGRMTEQEWTNKLWDLEKTFKTSDPDVSMWRDVVKEREEYYAQLREMKSRGIYRIDYIIPHKVDMSEAYSRLRNVIMGAKDYDKLPKDIQNFANEQEIGLVKGIMKAKSEFKNLNESEKALIAENIFRKAGYWTYDMLPKDIKSFIPKKTFIGHEIERKPGAQMPLINPEEAVKQYLTTMRYKSANDWFLKQVNDVYSNLPEKGVPGTIGWQADQYVNSMIRGRDPFDQVAKRMMEPVNRLLGTHFGDSNLIQKSIQFTRGRVVAGVLGPQSAMNHVINIMNTWAEHGSGPVIKALKMKLTGEWKGIPGMIEAWDLMKIGGGFLEMEGQKLDQVKVPMPDGSIVSGRDLGLGRKSVTRALDTMTDLVLSPLHAIVNFNRGVALLASMEAQAKSGLPFREGLRQGLSDSVHLTPDREVPFQVYKAWMDVGKTQFNFGKDFQAPIFNNNLARMSTFFWTYPTRMAQFFSRGIREAGLMGDEAKFFRYVSFLGMQMTALPLALGVAGVTIGHVLGPAGIVPFKFVSYPWEVLKNVYNATTGNATDKRKAWDDLKDEAMIFSIPGYAGWYKRAATAMDNASGGVKRTKAGYAVEETNGWREFMGFMGIPSTRGKQAYELASEARVAGEEYQVQKAKFTEMGLQAINAGNLEKFQKAIQSGQAAGIDISAKSIMQARQDRVKYSYLEKTISRLPKKLRPMYMEKLKALQQETPELGVSQGAKLTAGTRPLWSHSPVEQTMSMLDQLGGD
jgi:hypothetical protein